MDSHLKDAGHVGEPISDQGRWLRWKDAWDASNPTQSPKAPAGHSPAQQAGQDLQIQLRPGDRILRKSRRIALGTHRSTDDVPGLDNSRLSHTCFYIDFQRTGVRLSNSDGSSEIATSNEVSFHNFGDSFMRKPLGPEGDDHHWIAIESALMHEIIRSKLSQPNSFQAAPRLRAAAPISARLFFAQLKMFSVLASPNNRIGASQLETMVIDLVSQILDEALRFWRRSQQPKTQPRPTCLRRRLEVVQVAKAIMAREYWNDLSLTELSRTLHCSSAHLSRVFHDVTGFKLVDYRQQLRLRKGLFLLEHSLSDIGDIAVHLGFASHSHFTSSFHRSFGTHPSQFVKWKAESQSNCLAA